MTVPDVGKEWLELYEQLEARGEAMRDSQSVALGLLAAYDELSEAERESVHPILAEWMASDDSKHRYDARFLTGLRCIRSMKPSIMRAIDTMEHKPSPEAKYEVRLLRRILAALETGSTI